jgi:hypothetical protein
MRVFLGYHVHIEKGGLKYISECYLATILRAYSVITLPQNFRCVIYPGNYCGRHRLFMAFLGLSFPYQL